MGDYADNPPWCEKHQCNFREHLDEEEPDNPLATYWICEWCEMERDEKEANERKEGTNNG